MRSATSSCHRPLMMRDIMATLWEGRYVAEAAKSALVFMSEQGNVIRGHLMDRRAIDFTC